MKSPLTAGIAFLSLHVLAAAEHLPYSFTNFEDRQEYPAGPWRDGAAGLQVTTPEARVAEGSSDEESRHLLVSGAVAQVGRRFTGDGQTHLELWARPRAEQPGEGAEFLDFDGAALALFATGEREAEFHALHITEDDKGYWIATGTRVRLQGGGSEKWHSVHIIQHWEQGTWDLALDGVRVLEGIGRGTCADGPAFALWLYGTRAGETCAFDDVLVSSLPPDELEKQMALAKRLRAPPWSDSLSPDKRVGPQTQDARRRQHQQSSPKRAAMGQIKSLEMRVEVVGGGRHIGEFESKEKSGEMSKFALYTPGYDEDGKPKPLQVRLSCDAQLEEGASLADIEWAITGTPKDEGKDGRMLVVLRGTFEKGPTLVATVPAEWSNKPLSIHCGNLGLKRR